jgi:hypothetical protein
VALAVCLLFDRRSDRALRALWDRLEGRGVPSLRSHTHGQHVPHVSYAVLRTWEQAAVTAALSGWVRAIRWSRASTGLGLFRRGRAWLLTGVTSDFVARQEQVVSAMLATGADLHKQTYPPGPATRDRAVAVIDRSLPLMVRGHHPQ